MGKEFFSEQMDGLTEAQKTGVRGEMSGYESGEERERKKPTRCNNQMFIISFCLNMFRASLCPSSGEQRTCVTACGVLRWFCWMWLVAVVGRCNAAWVSNVHYCNSDVNILKSILSALI